MKYRVFDSEQEALAAEAAIAQEMSCPVVGINVRSGHPDPGAQVTERWAIPIQILDGRWVFPSPDEVGVESESDWFVASTGI